MVSRKWISRNAVKYSTFSSSIFLPAFYISQVPLGNLLFQVFFISKTSEESPKTLFHLLSQILPSMMLTKSHHCFVTLLFTWWLSNLLLLFYVQKIVVIGEILLCRHISSFERTKYKLGLAFSHKQKGNILRFF